MRYSPLGECPFAIDVPVVTYRAHGAAQEAIALV